MRLRELAASRDRLEHILATIPAAVTVTDGVGRLVYANLAAAEMSGFDRVEDMLAMGPGQLAERFLLLDSDGRVLSGEQLPSRRVATGESREGEVLLRVVDRVTGDELWRRVRATPLVDPDGRRLAVTVIEDVTEAKEAELRQAFLARAGEVLASSLDYTETLRRVAELAVPALADWCAVDIVDDRGVRRQVGLHHQDPAKLAFARELNERYPPDPASPQGVYGVLRSGRPELVSEIPDELLATVARDEGHLELFRKIGMRSVIIAPMNIRGRTIGAISFVSAETQRSFDATDLHFAMELARRAAVAVENARLYTSRTAAARTLQQTLLPDRLRQPDGWRAASSYRPGDDLNEVGGDFFDLAELPDGGLLAFVGDVTGKGVRAAALTSLARHALEVGARFDARPSALMRLLEDVLSDRDDAAPITVACVRVTPTDSGAVASVTCAGHPPPLLLRADEEPRLLGSPDILLGTGLGKRWREVEVELRPGDTLFLYTDGITDTPGTSSRFGQDRLLATAIDGPLDPSSVLARVDAATTAWQSGRAVDDRAMLALQLQGHGPPLALLAGGGASAPA